MYICSYLKSVVLCDRLTSFKRFGWRTSAEGSRMKRPSALRRSLFCLSLSHCSLCTETRSCLSLLCWPDDHCKCFTRCLQHHWETNLSQVFFFFKSSLCLKDVQGLRSKTKLYIISVIWHAEWTGIHAVQFIRNACTVHLKVTQRSDFSSILRSDVKRFDLYLHALYCCLMTCVNRINWIKWTAVVPNKVDGVYMNSAFNY